MDHLKQHSSDDLVRVAVAAMGCIGSYLSWIPRDKILNAPSLNLMPVLSECLRSPSLQLRTESLGVPAPSPHLSERILWGSLGPARTRLLKD